MQLSRQKSFEIILHVAAWSAVVFFLLARFPGITNTHFHVYDEGLYFYSAHLTVEGKMPYQDFFYAQPPGLLALSSTLLYLGLDLGWQRVIYAMAAFALPLLIYCLAKRIYPSGAVQAAWLGSLLAVSDPLFFNHSRTVTTDVPASLLTLSSIVAFLGTKRYSWLLSAILMVAAALFKLPSLAAAPGILLMGLIINGKAGVNKGGVHSQNVVMLPCP
jgi:hypothetical protein